MTKIAAITGINGQDGSYLAEYLLEKNYTVIGLCRRSSTNTNSRINHLLHNKNLVLEEFDLTDPSSCNYIVDKYKPHELYNLAAMSHVATSFKQPSTTFQIDTIGVVNLLESIRHINPTTRFYQASTSEMFGSNYSTRTNSQTNDIEYYQNENTPFLPQSPYAVAKLASHRMVQIYREAYELFACSGILFNHECLSSFMPIIYKNNNVLHIDNISDFFKKHIKGSQGLVDESIKIWDQNGWTNIKYASSFQHDLNENKGLRIINSRNSIYAVTNDHICIKEDSSECESKNLNIGDKVKLISYPTINNSYDINLEFSEMLGMLVGDGHIKGSHGQFTNKNKEILQRFAYLWSKFGGSSKYYDSISGFTGNIVGRLDLSNVREVLSEYDFYTELLDVFGHRYKKVPYQILNSNQDCMEAFLIGYNVCDGLKSNPCKYKFKNFKTNSATLAAGLLFLISKVSGQKYNMTIEESWKHGKQQFYYSINLLSNNTSNISKFNKVKSLLHQELSQREIHKQTGISRSFISKVKNGYIPSHTHHLELCSNEIKKIIDIPNYDGWFFDLETDSGTFHAGIGQAVIHNSPRRGENFVTRKITKYIGQIATNNLHNKKLHLGNLEAKRDWGHAKDYVIAMYLMLNASKPEDYVISTGHTYTVRNFLEKAFSLVNLDYNDYIHIDPELYRPCEVNYLKGDSSKAREKLNWEPKVSFDSLVEEMVHYDIENSKYEKKF
jgi:GDPmannose 4,6-dehydratase